MCLRHNPAEDVDLNVRDSGMSAVWSSLLPSPTGVAGTATGDLIHSVGTQAAVTRKVETRLGHIAADKFKGRCEPLCRSIPRRSTSLIVPEGPVGSNDTTRCAALLL